MNRTLERIPAAQAGDRGAMDAILRENTPLIWSIARRFFGRGAEGEDLFQLGSIGLIKAVRDFDLSQNVAFSTYAVPKIAGEMRRFLRDDGPVKVSRTIRERAVLVRRTQEALEREPGESPRRSALARACSLSEEAVLEALQAPKETESLEAALFSQGEENLLDKLPAPGEEDPLLDRMDLLRAMDTLEPRLRRVVALRYGRELTQQRTADLLGISQVQVSRLEKKALALLRAQMAAERTGTVDLGENMLRKAKLKDGLPVPVLRGGIVEHRGRDLGILGLLFAGQEIAKKIRQEQHRLRIFQRHVALAFTAVELIDGVEVLVGDAGARKERREIDDLPGLLKILVHCAAIGARIAKQMAVAVEQAVVHAPGVDADAVEITDVFLLEGKQAKLELIVEIRQIPIEYAVHLDVVVFEAVQLLHGDLAVFQPAEDRAAIAGAKVKGKQILHRINLSFPQGSCGIFRFPSWR